MTEEHERILDLAERAIDLEGGSLWDHNLEKAIGKHGDACGRLWDELRRQVEARRGTVAVATVVAGK